MAGSPLGARPPVSLAPNPSDPSALHRVPATSRTRRVHPPGSPQNWGDPATSRTRRVHGVFNLGAELAVVYSARRAGDGQAVTIELSDTQHLVALTMTAAQARALARALVVTAEASEGAQRLAGTMTAAQARAMARALVVAAEASEGAQRRPPVERRASPANKPIYSALAPSGERVLLPVGVYFNRDGQLQGGDA